MQWIGKTHEQWLQRTLGWTRTFALFPMQMNCGRWVWLEHYEVRREPDCRGGDNWIRRFEGSDEFDPGGPTGPPPPKPRRLPGSVQPRGKVTTTPPPKDD